VVGGGVKTNPVEQALQRYAAALYVAYCPGCQRTPAIVSR